MKHSVSVVIPVYNDSDNLKNCLTALFDTPEREFSVIIIDDGSSDKLEIGFSNPACKLIRLSENKGQAYARNIGVKESDSDIILFTDADCLPMKDWVKRLSDELIKRHDETDEAAAIYGRLDSEKTFFSMAQGYTSYAYCLGGVAKPMEYLNTACAAIYRDAFWEAGGFSEDMRVNEDPDLALKLVERGYKVFFEPLIYVFHNHGVNTLKKFLSKQFKWGRESGLRLDLRHKNRIKFLRPLLMNPFTHFLLVIPLAFVTALKIVLYNLRFDPKVIIYTFIIFLGKIFYRWGNFVSCIRGGS